MKNNFLDIISNSDSVELIDLHTFSDTNDAREFLNSELYRLYTNGEHYVRVIHGIGEGILKSIVHDELAQNPLIKAAKLEGHGGATILTYYPQ